MHAIIRTHPPFAEAFLRGVAFLVVTLGPCAPGLLRAASSNQKTDPISMSASPSPVASAAELLIVGISLDIMGPISFLMLMGIVMKNGILMVDYPNQSRERGRSLYDAVFEAGTTRMRPVLMTAVSTLFGFLPLTLGRGDGSEWRALIGIIAIARLPTSTVLTRLVVPVVYTLFDEAQTFVLGLFQPRSEEGRVEEVQIARMD